jgi:hypothetical protein
MSCKRAWRAVVQSVWRAAPWETDGADPEHLLPGPQITEADIVAARVPQLKDWLRRVEGRLTGSKAELQERVREQLRPGGRLRLARAPAGTPSWVPWLVSWLA